VLKIRRYVITKNEIVEALEYMKGEKLKYYIYSYKISRGRKWITLARWDNIDGIEHMDIYDENGNLMDTREFAWRKFDDIVKIIKTFRKNIIVVDVNNL